ncbi:Por secretion system C-terminal sorting domain-containing protein [Cyclobacterium lianum]|uniref:Por secretion system C-terminal sorting domain-containing protein n=1 Tax=Cyclobacterium lianum TaxID=388280 RepID=A0A1M7Q8I3_9BACT|nr:S8 family serine peptidase [Cyclobacterium lianum]SHN26951.1 Por secretion system C-terminal sorting domain-containing protein [Cyclobacterium lianum]
MRKLIALTLLLLVAKAGFIQAQEGMRQVRSEVFQRLQDNVRRYSLKPEEKSVIAEAMGIPLVMDLADQRVAVFQYLDDDNHPVYYTTHNLNAAAATGTNSLQAGGNLNLNLSGTDMIIGIYDQTRPKANHNEFGNRVTQIDGSTEEISNHATHVTGTILAAGNNRNAAGMAREAIGWAFNWDADISKMTQNSYDPDLNPGGHLISNHSYGFLMGWYRDSNNNWTWAGNEGISASEDYRFGFYTNKSRQIDELAFAKPFYTIIWAAGNDRSDVGDGSRDADGPDDSIGPEGVAKNSLTIGAVSLQGDYTGPSDVNMSSFSSWGPVDDGRIKPDLVGMGVNVFSSAIQGENGADSYATLSGTSMATPNVSGSLLLVQELYRNRNAGRYMLSATLKALAIQTAREAGMNPGPDYMHGWGLLDTEAAANMIIDEDGSSKIIRELNLQQGETYEFEFISNGVDPIKTTIAWTDPAGTSPALSVNPTDLMLVNDLDLRIIDENGNTFFPWTLNPRDGSSAIASRNGDNFRDNVEQVSIENPNPQRYTVRVSHKGDLANSQQPYSLVFSAGVSDGQANTLYWIGTDGNWDNPNNWSENSSGPSANIIPDEGTRVVIDRPLAGQTISLSENTDVFSLNIFGQEPLVLDLNQNELLIRNGFRSSNNLTNVRNGLIHFEGTDQNENILDFGQLDFSDVNVWFDEGRWRVLSMPGINELEISEAVVEFGMERLLVNEVELSSGTRIRGGLTTVEFKSLFRANPGVELPAALNMVFTGENGVYEDFSISPIRRLVNLGGNLQVNASGNIARLELNGETQLNQDMTHVGVLDLTGGSALRIGDGLSLLVEEGIEHGDAPGGQTIISSPGKAILIHEPYRKYCFEGLNVQNVDLQGESVINLGPQSTVINAANWSNILCENVLLANFNVAFNCAGGLAEFENLSEGNITAYNWDFGGLGTSTATDPTFIFNNPRTYTISLEISGPGGVNRYEKSVVINPNSLRRPEIVANGSQLSSRIPASSYQWYRDGEPIEGARERSYMVADGGAYQVAVIDDQCNRLSAVVVVSSSGEDIFSGRSGYAIGPNPVAEKLSLFVNNSYMGEIDVRVFDGAGRLKQQVKFDKERQGMEFVLDFVYTQGLYLIQVQAGKEVQTFKVMKE